MASAAAGSEPASIYIILRLQDGGSTAYRLVPAWATPRRFVNQLPLGFDPHPAAVHFAAVSDGRVAASVELRPPGEAADLRESSGESTTELLLWPLQQRACISLLEGTKKMWDSVSAFSIEDIDSRERECLGHICSSSNNLSGGISITNDEDGVRLLGHFPDMASLDFAPIKMRIGRDIIINEDNKLGDGAEGNVVSCGIYRHQLTIKVL